MKLEKILENIEYSLIKGALNTDIKSLVYDSRKVENGSLFVCLKGAKFDGHAYAKEVTENGAVALIVEDDVDESINAAVIKVKDSREALALLSAAWFDYPAKKLTVIGITGTKGKTTTAHMIKSILESSGNKTGMIGTMGAYIGTEKKETKNTTPESYELHSLFDEMFRKGCKYVVMEASSQGFKMKRTYGIEFDYAMFLNISPDHIGEGEHKDFEEYLFCKSIMFTQCKNAIANIDDERWKDVLNGYNGNLIGISTKCASDVWTDKAENLWDSDKLGIKFNVHGLVERQFSLAMPGIFNVYNALMAVTVCNAIGIDCDSMQDGFDHVYVKGRTQLVKCALPITTVIIDYAHNALSMEELLKMLKSYNPKRLICLFGGGGNKPKARRFDMGAMSGKYADLTVLTTDNPRFEEVDNINNEIIEGINKYNGKYQIIKDREEAIKYLLDNATRDDIIALIGKGHEEYQDIKGVKYYFSEQEIIEDYMKG